MFPTHPSDVVTLSETDRSRLQTFVHRGQESAHQRTRTQVLLKLGEGWSLEAVCAAFDVCRNTAVGAQSVGLQIVIDYNPFQNDICAADRRRAWSLGDRR